MPRHVIVLLLAVVAATSAACGPATVSVSQRVGAEDQGKRISGYGLSIALPGGWTGRIFKRDARTAVAVRAANFPIYLGASVVPGSASADMPADGVLIELDDLELPVPNPSREEWVRATPPIEIRRSDLGRFEGATTPGFALRNVVVAGRSLMVGVGFGTEEPSDALLAEANQVLASLGVDPNRSAWGGEQASGQPPRVAFRLPNGWFGGETSLGQGPPIPVAWAGNVPFVDDPAQRAFPTATVRSLPPDGIVIETVGPRPYTGDADFPRLTLPLKLSDGFCASSDYEGQPAPNVSFCEIDAWVGGDVLNVTVWLGRNEPSPEMTAEANKTLATLSIAQ